jgi:hypothetical protein
MKTSSSAILQKALIATILATAAALAPSAGVAFGDTLELRTGQIVQGKFVGGSSLSIRFQTDGLEQVFPTKDVLNIGFSDSGDNASNVAPAPTPAPAPEPEPESAATPSQPMTPETPSAPPAPERSNPPPAPPAPNSTTEHSAEVSQTITIPTGTSLLVRMIDGIDSSQNKVGDTFRANLESALVVGNTVVAPQGSDVYGQLSQAKEAGKVSGGSQLTLELTGIRINGNIVSVDSTDYEVASKGRGSQSAERIGGAAVVGAIIGGVIGGGKGAAIGAGVGAGGGTAVQLLTKGDQVRIPSETLLEFKLQQDVTVPLPGASN